MGTIKIDNISGTYISSKEFSLLDKAVTLDKQKNDNVSDIKFIVAGDLSSAYFIRNHKMAQFTNTYLGDLQYGRVIRTTTASIYGLYNNERIDPHTDSFKNQLNNALEKGDIDYLVICLGQNDIEFIYYYQSIIKNECVKNFIEKTVESYKQYLVEISKAYNVDIIIKGINPSTLINRSDSIWYVAKVISELCFDIKEEQQKLRLDLVKALKQPSSNFDNRFNLIADFNKSLEQLAIRMNWGYFDIFDKVTNGNKMVLLPFIPARSSNLLLDTVKLRQIHYDTLKNLFQGIILK